MSLLESDPSGYSGAFPTIEKPSVVGEMCVSRQREVLPGRSRAKYLNEKAIGRKCAFNLNLGYDVFESKDVMNNEKLDVLLKWIMIHSEPGCSLRKICHEADIVCWRGTLTRIACSPYERRDGWRIAAVRYNSVMFLCEFPTDEKMRQLESMSYRDKMMTYWGFKFEQYVTSDSLSAESDVNEPVTNLEEFGVVVKTRLGGRKNGIRILYSGETDCIDAEGDYVELKTQRKELNDSFWRYKAMKWWVQSFLIGIQNVVVGYRDDNADARYKIMMRMETTNGRLWQQMSQSECPYILTIENCSNLRE